MSYQQDVRDVLTSSLIKHGSRATFEVTLARPGTFEMKVVLMDGADVYEENFDLSNSMTPRTRKIIQEWVEPILTRSASGRSDEKHSSAGS